MLSIQIPTCWLITTFDGSKTRFINGYSNTWAAPVMTDRPELAKRFDSEERAKRWGEAYMGAVHHVVIPSWS